MHSLRHQVRLQIPATEHTLWYLRQSVTLIQSLSSKSAPVVHEPGVSSCTQLGKTVELCSNGITEINIEIR